MYDHGRARRFATALTVQKLSVEIFTNIEFASVVTSSDGFDIPFYEIVF